MKFISAADIDLVLAQAPDIEWRLVISLARWGGLRIPFEIAELRWEHVNWETNRITILVPKLEHIAGQGQRVIPPFPELMPVIRKAFETAAERAIHIVPHLGGDAKSLRATFNKLVARAGLTTWTRRFANLRSTRATELAGIFPLKTVAEWMGHDPTISSKNYQQVLPEYWDRTTSTPTPDRIQPQKTGANSGAMCNHLGSFGASKETAMPQIP